MKIFNKIATLFFFLSGTAVAGTTLSISAGGSDYQCDECHLTNWDWQSLGTPTEEIWDVPLDKERVRKITNWRTKAGD